MPNVPSDTDPEKAREEKHAPVPERVALPGGLYAGTGQDKPAGVLLIEAIASVISSWHLWALFFCIFVEAYCFGLEGGLRISLQPAALASFGASAQISTVTVVRSIIAAVIQPVFAKASDYFGRMTIVFTCLVFYCTGIIVQATSKSVGSFSAGALVNEIGYTAIMLLVLIMVSDSSSLRNRLFFTYLLVWPTLINTWVTGTIAQKILIGGTGWRWGIGMWGCILPAATVPLWLTFYTAKRRAAKAGLLDGIPRVNLLSTALWVDLFWAIDVIGLFLLGVTLALILIPFTVAGGVQSLWKTAKIITPLVVGLVVTLPLFIIWQLKFARSPLLPAHVLRNRQVYFALAIPVLYNATWYLQGDYLYYTLIISFDKNIETATRVSMIYGFVGTIVGSLFGLVVRRIRRLKPVIIAGGLMIILAFGILIRFRGGKATSEFAGLVAGEVLLGCAAGLLPYSTQVLTQSMVKHEHTAVITSLYFCGYHVGSALGNTIAGAIWTNTLPKRILNNMLARGVPYAPQLAASSYADPFTFAFLYPYGTVARDALNAAYREVQKLLCITGICLAVVMLGCILVLKDTTLSDKQSNDDVGGEADSEREREADAVPVAVREK